ncbi:MAG: metallophosphoesterase family protein [Syntrophomonadaceae bacterium]|nr:metallophosphoesterase family protein [Syntrophomonadaceae bacterium]
MAAADQGVRAGMRLFVTSDLHGSPVLGEKLASVLADIPVDAAVVCGDVTGQHRTRTANELLQRQREDLQALRALLASLPCPAWYILGNMDFIEAEPGDPYYLPFQQHPQLLAFELVNRTPFRSHREASFQRLQQELWKLEAGPHSIVVAHAPPFRAVDLTTGGQHAGSLAARQYIERVQPLAWCCGHIHEAYGADVIGSTLVLNAACDPRRQRLRGFVLDTPGRTWEAIER